MQVAVPESNKKVGVVYAVTDDGLELPVIDVTNPAFAIDIGQNELDRLLQEHLRSVKNQSRLSKLIQPLMLRLMARRSIVIRGIMEAAGGYMTGMNTYILKLGPDNMGNGYAGPIDRQISASISGLSMRLRFQDVAHLLADGSVPALAANRGKPLHLLNIGGGPAIDSLNALIILHKQRSELLAGRALFIHSLDLDEAGPNFGRRALEALQAQDAPLHGLDIHFQHTNYNWSDTAVLRELVDSLRGKAVMAASSEGALFEYGSDEDITANLRALHYGTPPDAIVVGSLTRSDATGRILNTSSRAAIKLRGLEAFSALVQAAGWRLAQSMDRPMSHDLVLRKA